MTEYEVLDTLFEVLPDDIEFGVDLYEQRGTMVGPEMYVRMPNGECWRISATYHGNHN